jgi:hypothetical protein
MTKRCMILIGKRFLVFIGALLALYVVYCLPFDVSINTFLSLLIGMGYL